MVRRAATNLFDKITQNRFKGGYSRVAAKNSIYQFATTLIAKGGSLIFTIILLRMLVPEIFGLYSIALTTIVLFASLSDFGLINALVHFVAKKKDKSRGYLLYIVKLKIFLTSLASAVLIILAYWIANDYYQKPIFYALIAGAFYIISTGFSGFIAYFFQAKNDFKQPLYKEIIFQILRLIIIPVISIFFASLSSEFVVFWIILALAFCYFASSLFLLRRAEFSGKANLSRKEKLEVIHFVLPLSFTIIASMLFGYIDVLMLGRFVNSEFVAFYQAPLNLISSLSALISFGTVMFPIFSSLTGKRLKSGLIKSMRIIFIISLMMSILAFLFAKPIIQLAGGNIYQSSILIFQIMALVILTDPLINLLTNYLISIKATAALAKISLMATVINISLNYLSIMVFLGYGMYYAVIGVAAATIFSKLIYFSILYIYLKRKS